MCESVPNLLRLRLRIYIEKYHKPSHFLAYSALSDVGHGEYIEASIKVPEKLPNSEKCVIFDMNKELFGFNFYHVLCTRKKP